MSSTHTEPPLPPRVAPATDLDILAGIIDELNRSASFEAAADRLVAWACEVTGAATGLLRLVEEGDDGPWVPVCVSRAHDPLFERDQAVVMGGECICGAVATGSTASGMRLAESGLPFFTAGGSFRWGRMSTLVADFPSVDFGFLRGRCAAEGFESVAVFPLVGQAGVVGSLHLADPRPDLFEPETALLEAACRVAGRLLLNHRRDERLRAVQHAVERALSPGSLPEVEGLEIGVQAVGAGDGLPVGGDFFDVLDVSPAGVLVLLGDCTGKGLNAAGVASRVRYLLTRLAGATPDPSSLLAGVNRLLHGSIPGHTFVPAVVSLIGPGDGDVTVALAGHPAPILVQQGGYPAGTAASGTAAGAAVAATAATAAHAADSTPPHEDLPTNLPLGIREHVHFRQVTLGLRPGDTLVFFTDGIIDARRDGEFFGVENVVEVCRAGEDLSCNQLAQAVCSASAAFQGDGKDPDDCTVIVVRRTVD